MHNDTQKKNFITKNKKLLATSAALAALVVAVLWIVSCKGQYLLLRNGLDDRVVFCVEMAEGESFSVSFRHSVNKSPVTECYRIQDSKIYLTELHYSAFGAGMPTEPEENQVMRIDKNEMIIEGFAREMPYLCYYIGRVAEHTLHWRNESVLLRSLDEPGQPVLFTTATWPRFFIWMKIYPEKN